MNETINQNQPPSENLSVAALAASMLARQIEKSSAGTPSSAADPAASTETTAALQQTAAGTEETSEQTLTPTPEAEQQLSPTNDAPETPPGDEPAPPDETASDEEDHKAAAEEEATQPLPKAVQSLRDRVHTVCDQRDAARDAAATAKAEAEALKAQNQQLAEQVTQLREGTPPNVRSIDRFSGHPAVKNIDARLSNVDSTLAWCDANPEGGESKDDKGNVHNFSTEEVRRIQRQVERDRASLVAERAQKVGRIEDAETVRREANDIKAQKAYPWVKNQQAPEYQTLMAVANAFPGVKQDPVAAFAANPELFLTLCDAARGRLAREAEEKKGVVRPAAPAKRPNTANPPNVTTQAAAAPRVTNPLETQLKMAEEEYSKTPTQAVFTKLTLLKLRLKDQGLHRAAA